MATERAGSVSSLSSGQGPRSVPHRPRVFILSPIRLLRDGIAAALSRQSTIQVVGLSDLSMPPVEIAGFCPDVIVLDIFVPGALEIAGPLQSAMPATKVVALGVAEVERVVMACARAGVSGFVHPDGSANDLVTAVHSAVRGELVCSPRTAGMLLHRVRSLAAGPADGAVSEALTPREQEILKSGERRPVEQADRPPAQHSGCDGQESRPQHPEQARGAAAG